MLPKQLVCSVTTLNLSWYQGHSLAAIKPWRCCAGDTLWHTKCSGFLCCPICLSFSAPTLFWCLKISLCLLCLELSVAFLAQCQTHFLSLTEDYRAGEAHFKRFVIRKQPECFHKVFSITRFHRSGIPTITSRTFVKLITNSLYIYIFLNFQ